MKVDNKSETSLKRFANYFYGNKIRIAIGSIIASEILYTIIYFVFDLNQSGFIGFYLTFIMAGGLSYLIGGKLFNMNKDLKRAQSALLIANAELENASQLKSQMLSVVAHDIRSPITSLISMADLLKEQCSSTGNIEEKRLLEMIVEQSNSTITAVDELLTWAKNTSEHFSVQIDQFNLSEIVQIEHRLLGQAARQKGIELKSHLDETLFIYADKNAVSFIVRNLINNAIKFSHSESEILLKTYSNNDTIYFECQDQGTGMSNDQLENLFSKQQNSTISGTRDEAGFGFGLPMAYHYAQQMGGRIDVESELGKGTMVRLCFPC